MPTALSNIVTAFKVNTVGTKVLSPFTFWGCLHQALETYNFPENGQGFVPLTCLDAVSCGIGFREGRTAEDYVIREWRGEVSCFLKRQFAAKAESLAAIVYTAKAYKADPQVTQEEASLISDDHFVLVAVLASVGPKLPLSSHRFTRNLAGGNLRYTPEQGYTLEQAKKEAAEIVAYEKTWSVVSD
jgi:hypothetical protein